jgi:(p)ppGpp synthase/HD superfamily hydrolase
MATDADAKRAMLELIERGHAGQMRNGGRVPYWVHPQSVAGIVGGALDATGEADPALALDVFLAAQGHDLYEDTEVEPDEVARRFGARVDAFIRGMTNEEGDHDRAAYLARVAAAPEEVKLIKLGDLIDNALSCAYGQHDLGTKWTRSFFLPIAEEMRGVLAGARFERFPRAAELLRRELDFALSRLHANVASFERLGL